MNYLIIRVIRRWKAPRWDALEFLSLGRIQHVDNRLLGMLLPCLPSVNRCKNEFVLLILLNFKENPGLCPGPLRMSCKRD